MVLRLEGGYPTAAWLAVVTIMGVNRFGAAELRCVKPGFEVKQGKTAEGPSI
jgi:hypothetical protein